MSASKTDRWEWVSTAWKFAKPVGLILFVVASFIYAAGASRVAAVEQTVRAAGEAFTKHEQLQREERQELVKAFRAHEEAQRQERQETRERLVKIETLLSERR